MSADPSPLLYPTDVRNYTPPTPLLTAASSATLLALTGMLNGQIAQLTGRGGLGDGGYGQFYYDANDSTTPPDGSLVMAPTFGSGRWKRLHNGEMDVRWFGADPGGVVDSTAAIQAAVNAVAALPGGGGGKVYIAAGTYYTTGTITVPSFVTIEGPARGNPATINFNPPIDGAEHICFNFAIASHASGYRSGVRQITFTGSTNTTRVAINVDNWSVFTCEKINVLPGWGGTSQSIGVRTRGREFLRFAHLEIACAKPIVIDVNTGIPSISIDHSSFVDCYLTNVDASVARSAVNTAAITISDGVILTNTRFEDCAFVDPQHGIYWNDTVSAGASNTLIVANCRMERQATGPGGYIVYINKAVQGLQNLKIDNVYGGAPGYDYGGIWLKNCPKALLSCCGAGASAASSLTLDATTCSQTQTNNCSWSGPISAAGMDVYSSLWLGQNSPGSELYVDSAAAQKGVRFGGVNYWAYGASLAAGGIHTLSIGTGGKKAVFVRCALANGEYFDLVDIAGTVTTFHGSANFATTNVANKLCYLANGLGNPQITQNFATAQFITVTAWWTA